MLFLTLKVAHLLSIIIWLAGILALPFILSAAAASPAPHLVAQTFRRWYLRLFSPALFGIWGFGIAMMILGDFTWEPWMLTKIVIAFVLAGLHGPLSARLRKMASDEDYTLPQTGLPIFAAMLVLIVVILGLVEFKPF